MLFIEKRRNLHKFQFLPTKNPGICGKRLFTAATVFCLLLQSTAEAMTTLELRVTNNVSRIVERKASLPANGIIRLGKHYKPGIYR